MNINTELLLQLLASFTIGSTPFAIIAMIGSGTDIRTIGSGNPGFNNVLRFSKPRALITLAGDMAKGFIPVWLFFGPENYINFGWLLGFCAIFGHCYSPWLRFKGGKGIATSCGAMLALYPSLAAMALVFFALTRTVGSRMKLKQRGAFASVLTWVFFTIVLHFQSGMPHTRYAILLTLFLAWQHKSNIRSMFQPSQSAN